LHSMDLFEVLCVRCFVEKFFIFRRFKVVSF